jgi:N-acetylglucosaminyldiphosphoundecaprenol N-acetyl-beta-D-mannosaminyltransferase
MQETLERLEQFIEQRRFHQVATANTDFLINALDDKELRYVLREADLVVPDGMPLVWGAQLMGTHLPERVTGADLVPALAKLAAEKGYRIFMLGARPEVALRAKERLEEDYKGIQIVGCLSPDARPILEMDNDCILAAIQQAKPDILFVAFGNPKQEKWIHLFRDQLREVPICIRVGGTFDFLAGQTVRAPLWMQKAGLEWLFRLLQEPKRLWKRYYRDITQFSRYLFRQWRALSWGRGTGQGEVYFAEVGDSTVISVLGDFSGALIPRFREITEQAINSHRHLLLDFQQVSRLDVQALGALLNLPKRASFRDCDVRLVAAPPQVLRALTRSQIEDGHYQLAPSMAQAFTNVRIAGLVWTLEETPTELRLLISGATERNGVKRLEGLCENHLRAGKTVVLDMSNVSYVDSLLLTALKRLSQISEGKCQIVPGQALLERLQREKLHEPLPLASAPAKREEIATR